MQSNFLNRAFVYNAPFIESILTVSFPVGTLCITLFVIKKKLKETNRAVQHLINLWLVGSTVILLSDFILVCRQVASRLTLNDLQADCF